MCVLHTSGYIEPEPINPNPPALDTAEANSQPLHQIIPAWIMGNFMLNNWVTEFIRHYFWYKCKDFIIFDYFNLGFLMKNILLLFFILCLTSVTKAQWLWDYGFSLGVSNYLGDIGGKEKT